MPIHNMYVLCIGALLIVDSEEEFFPKKIEKLANDIKNHDLSIFVFAGKWEGQGWSREKRDWKMQRISMSLQTGNQISQSDQ